MMANFYDEVAKKFGGYGFSNRDPKYIKKYPDDDPEKVFTLKVEDLSGKKLNALDVGCGDGIFAFKVAGRFKKIFGLDSSKELLKIAKQKCKEFNIDNIKFVYSDASKTPFNNGSFDVIFNRRGPSFYSEYSRLLKPGGYYVEIGIGEKDTMTLKKIFGRGQGYGKWSKSTLKADQKELENEGMKIVFGKDYFYDEYYKDTANFELFLEGVPIFEDFDLSKDKKYLDIYYQHCLEKNNSVKLERHRIVLVAQKI
jgi:SAM-dependent methyltransferase